MYWQMTHDPAEPAAEPRRWIAKHLLPEHLQQRVTPAARHEDTQSVPQLVGMTEGILRLITQYPGLVDKVAHTIPLKPGQSRQDHFDTMMEAISNQARFHEGLGVAIADTLEPFYVRGEDASH